MKLWVDDIRDPHVGKKEDWTIARTADEAIDLLLDPQNEFTIVSLDHDLGDVSEKTGYDILLRIEEKVHDDPNYFPPHMVVHSANPVGRRRMNDAIRAIQQYLWGNRSQVALRGE